MGFELNEDQKELVSRIKKWYTSYTDKQWFAYTGPAGVGKTTVIRTAIQELGIDRYVCCAYVGKAVSVLAQNGLPATTIHSLIYDVCWVQQTDEHGDLIFREDGRPKMKIEFVLKSELRNDPELIVVDEATMVNDELCEQILSFGIKTVFIGDNNQLPPVFGVSSIMMRPDFWLRKIMRQAEGDPIIWLSQKILNHERIPFGHYGKCSVLPWITLDRTSYERYQMIMAPINRLRDRINSNVREGIMGFEGPLPVIGDRLICRNNNWSRAVDDNIFLTTGMCGTVTDINRSASTASFLSIDFQPDIASSPFVNLRLDSRYIQMDAMERKEYGLSQYEKFEYGYCITVHQAQGSQAEGVLFNDYPLFDADMTRRTRYTAITRAYGFVDIVSEVRFL